MGFKRGRRGRLDQDDNLDTLVRALTATPQTVTELANHTKLHPRTVRRIADALVEHGDAQTAPAAAASGGRGRPAQRYFVTPGVSKSKQSRSTRQRTLATVHAEVKKARAQRSRADLAVSSMQRWVNNLAVVIPATPSDATLLDKATAQLTQQLAIASAALDTMLDSLAHAKVNLESLTPRPTKGQGTAA